MNIFQIRGCWAANIGNAFLDLGCEYQLRQVFNKAKIVSVGGHNNWLFDFFNNQILESGVKKNA